MLQGALPYCVNGFSLAFIASKQRGGIAFATRTSYDWEEEEQLIWQDKVPCKI